MTRRNREPRRRCAWAFLFGIALCGMSACTTNQQDAGMQNEALQNLGEFVASFARTMLATYLL